MAGRSLGGVHDLDMDFELEMSREEGYLSPFGR